MSPDEVNEGIISKVSQKYHRILKTAMKKAPSHRIEKWYRHLFYLYYVKAQGNAYDTSPKVSASLKVSTVIVFNMLTAFILFDALARPKLGGEIKPIGVLLALIIARKRSSRGYLTLSGLPGWISHW